MKKTNNIFCKIAMVLMIASLMMACEEKKENTTPPYVERELAYYISGDYIRKGGPDGEFAYYISGDYIYKY